MTEEERTKKLAEVSALASELLAAADVWFSKELHLKLARLIKLAVDALRTA